MGRNYWISLPSASERTDWPGEIDDKITLYLERIANEGVCVATERKAGKFRLIILLVGSPERTQTPLSNDL
jgi:hypothetical protein